jgi:ketosteroid isomerase-like protein
MKYAAPSSTAAFSTSQYLASTMSELVDSYYEALDTHAYDQLEAVLDPDFVHERPDRTLEGRETFVRFMRKERPESDTVHELDTKLTEGSTVAIEGRVLNNDGGEIILFLDVHKIDKSGERIESLRTYTL